MNKYEYINAVRNTLNTIPVSGRENLNGLLGCLQALDKLEKLLYEEDLKLAKETPDPEAE